MHSNPYNPPSTDVQTEPNQAPPRPIAVWLIQIVLAIWVVIWVFGILRSVLAGEALTLAKQNPIVFAVGTAWRVALIAAVIFMIHRLHRRLRFSRWIGPVVIALIAIVTLAKGDTTHYANEAERAGGTVFRMLFAPLLFAWWGYASCFSQKARRYFASGRKGHEA